VAAETSDSVWAPGSVDVPSSVEAPDVVDAVSSVEAPDPVDASDRADAREPASALLAAALPERATAVVAIAVATLAATAMVAIVQDSVARAVLRAALVPVIVACSLIDLDHRIIPNRITGPAALALLVVGLALDPGGEPSRLVWTAGVAGFLLLASLVNPAGMGMGDVKLLIVIGLALGRPVVAALLLALIASVLTGIALASRIGMRKARKTALPFGPYLSAGAFVAALVGDPLLHALLTHHH
jgi:leader peptidase (prepilin peptidase)/N-methyltransferase